MLITNDKSVLRQVCSDVLPEEVDSLISILEKELLEINKLGNNGIGLAGPQIGIFKKIAIIRFEGQKINLINCNIEKSYNEFIFKNEACLSFPGKVIDTIRYKEVYITNNLVEPHSFIATDFLAVACQHEIDHFNGKLFFDKQVISNVTEKVNKIKQKPNEPCLCGKGLKYKKCCGK